MITNTPNDQDKTLKNVSVAISLGVKVLNEMKGKELNNFNDDEAAEMLQAFIANELGV